jgi:glutamine amidotransferase-like uncharacterized protein
MNIVPSIELIPAKYGVGTLLTQVPMDVSGDFSVSRTTSPTTNLATRVNASGFIETVADNVPRLDYYTSSGTPGCPALLVEPSGTNLLVRSNELNYGFPWSTTNIVFTTGSTSGFTSPDGTTNAFLMADTSVDSRHRISQVVQTSFVSGTTYTMSVFVKKNSSNRFLLLNANTAFSARAVLNLDTLAITNLDGSGASIDNYGNGWYRFSIRGTATTTQLTTVFIQMQNSASDADYIGNGSSFYLFGAQIEIGSIVTSYIPTTNQAITRNADVINKTSASGLIGQTEGTMYAEFEYRTDTSTRRILAISDGTQSNRIILYFAGGGITAAIEAGTMTVGTPVVGFNKVALGYIQSGVSGILTSSLNGGTVVSGTYSEYPASLNTVNVGKIEDTGTTSVINSRIRSVAIYKTRLPNYLLESATSQIQSYSALASSLSYTVV